MRNYLKAGVLTLLVAAAMAAPAGDESQSQVALQTVLNSAGDFSNAFYDVVSKNSADNLICSPFSADVVLTMASFGAGDNTAAQMKTSLRLPEDTVTKTGYQNLIETLNNVKDVQLSVANKIYTMKDFQVKPEFKELTKTNFLSESQTVDFSQSDAAAQTINSWCNDQTHGRIQEIVKADDLNALTRMVLLNAVYFKGNWAEQFNVNDTHDADFHLDLQTVKKVPTMYRKGDMKYGILPELKASFVELPYKGKELSMVIILPDDVEGLTEMERKLKDYKMSDILSKGYTQEVTLFLPKFKIESTIDLKQPLIELGMTDMFSDSTANFKNIADDPLYVSKVIQKAFIEVNEEGSEAAAVTGIITLTRAPAPPRLQITFRVDKPFYFAIKHQTPMFVGHVKNLA